MTILPELAKTRGRLRATWERIHGILWVDDHDPTALMEFYASAIALYWAYLILATRYRQHSLFLVLGETSIPVWVWGTFYLAAGMSGIVTLILDLQNGRRVTAILRAWLWGIVTYLMWKANQPTAGGYAVMEFFCLVIERRLRDPRWIK